MEDTYVYEVQRSAQPPSIDGNWDKPVWDAVSSLEIVNRMGDLPKFLPAAEAKVVYDHRNLFVIFRVHDRYVRCLVENINGPVYEEPCVEFFFSPDTGYPERYFNLEISCGGTPLMHFNDHFKKSRVELATDDIKMIDIAHSLPRVVNPEITVPVTWTIEYSLPFTLIRKYSRLTSPEPGIEWRANFYKIAEKGSNPHFLTWSFVDNPVPDFHIPRFFGMIKFQ